MRAVLFGLPQHNSGPVHRDQPTAAPVFSPRGSGFVGGHFGVKPSLAFQAGKNTKPTPQPSPAPQPSPTPNMGAAQAKALAGLQQVFSAQNPKIQAYPGGGYGGDFQIRVQLYPNDNNYLMSLLINNRAKVFVPGLDYLCYYYIAAAGISSGFLKTSLPGSVYIGPWPDTSTAGIVLEIGLPAGFEDTYHGNWEFFEDQVLITADANGNLSPTPKYFWQSRQLRSYA
jgi:hypothetical protein